jgi:hypothetical protein
MRSKRSSRLKANNTILRNRVFGPVEHERAKRLSEKLQKVAVAPLPEKPEIMEVDAEKSGLNQTNDEHPECKLRNLFRCFATLEW